MSIIFERPQYQHLGVDQNNGVERGTFQCHPSLDTVTNVSERLRNIIQVN